MSQQPESEPEAEWASEEESRAEFLTRIGARENNSGKNFLELNHTGCKYSEKEYWNFIRFMYGNSYLGN